MLPLQWQKCLRAALKGACSVGLSGVVPHTSIPCWATQAVTTSTRSAHQGLFQVSFTFKPHHLWNDDLCPTGLSSTAESSSVCNWSLFVLFWVWEVYTMPGLWEFASWAEIPHTGTEEKQNSLHISADILILDHCKLWWLRSTDFGICF